MGPGPGSVGLAADESPAVWEALLQFQERGTAPPQGGTVTKGFPEEETLTWPWKDEHKFLTWRRRGRELHAEGAVCAKSQEVTYLPAERVWEKFLVSDSGVSQETGSQTHSGVTVGATGGVTGFRQGHQARCCSRGSGRILWSILLNCRFCPVGLG